MHGLTQHKQTSNIKLKSSEFIQVARNILAIEILEGIRLMLLSICFPSHSFPVFQKKKVTFLLVLGKLSNYTTGV